MHKEVGKKLQSYPRKWQGRRRKATHKASSLDSGRRSGELGKGQKKMKRMIMEKAAGLLRSVNQLGNVNIAVTGAILGITTVLSMKATKSARFSAVSRFLP